jgi:hypothetical protein
MTVGVDKDIEQTWLRWIRDRHIPAVMRTGMFVDWKMFKVLHDDEGGTVSYSIQYFAETIENVQQYLDVFAPEIIEEHRHRFFNKHVVFQTLLEQV